jgi:hypothetical protein
MWVESRIARVSYARKGGKTGGEFMVCRFCRVNHEGNYIPRQEAE